MSQALLPYSRDSAAAVPLITDRALFTSARFHAFVELTKPGITRLVVLTAAAGFCLAARPVQWLLLLHALIGIGMAAAGANALNQWIERVPDSRMKRTARRPLPSGRLGGIEALVFSGGIALGGIVYLSLLVNLLTAAVVALSLFSYVFIYTPLKRVTWTSTVIGAVPGALPIVAGWTAAGGALNLDALVLFLILFAWQMPHFYALAWIYRDDYRRGGFQMLTVVDPSGTRAAGQGVFYACVLVPLSTLPTLFGLTGALYLTGALLLSITFLVFSIRSFRLQSDREAWRLFMSSVVYLPALFILMVVNRI